MPLINGRILAWRIQTARVRVIRGGGHLFLLGHPGKHGALVATFLTAA